MLRTASLRLLSALLGMVLLPLAQPVFAAATAPANDDFANPTLIGSLPFSDSLDTTAATSGADDPVGHCGNSGSVWYAFTPTETEMVVVDTIGSDYETGLSVFTGTRGALTFVTCSQDFQGPRVGFNATAGNTYFLMAGMCCTQGVNGGGHLVLHAAVLSPPTNDDFANATQVTSLPFQGTVDTLGASLELGEPAPSCGNGPLAGSAWYAFTPTANGSVTATEFDQFSTGAVLAIYTGASVNQLTEAACRVFGFSITVPVVAGTTYHIQVGGQEDRGPMTVDLAIAPPPIAAFFALPSDPSIFDTVHLGDQSFDPAASFIASRTWTLGDGTTASGTDVTHRYTTDGDYTVVLSIATADGRTATATSVVHVATHDVAIAGFNVPSTARAGQTRAITVRLRNTRYPETVDVQLRKSLPGGTGAFETVATATVNVPARSSDKTTPVAFNYTFTDDDAAVGKVTFEAVVTIRTFRDALPADNAVIAPFTGVAPARTASQSM